MHKLSNLFKMLLFFLLCSMLGCPSSATLASSAEVTPLRDYYRESWTTREGLPHNSINDVAQSGDGYLWLATWEGAARFDGRTFKVFPRGSLTGFLDSGVRKFWREENGTLLLGGARGGLSAVNNSHWQPLPHSNNLINDVFRDKQGKLWLATEGSGVQQQLPSGEYQTFQQVPSLVVYRILQDADGTMWFATEAGLFSYNEQSATFQQLTPDMGLPAGAIFTLAFDSRDDLLVGGERGAYRLVKGRFQLIAADLANVGITALLVDRDGQIWLGGFGLGLFRLSSLGLERLEAAQGLPNNRVLALFEDNESSIWVGTNGGLMQLRKTPFTTLTTAQGLSDNYVRTLLEHSDGSLWIGSSSGLDQHRNNTITPFLRANGEPMPSVLSLAEGPDGDLWVGAYNDGVFRLRDGKVIAAFQREQGLGSNEIRAILPLSEDDVLIGTSAGLTRITAGKVKIFTRADGLPSVFISSLMRQRNGRIWVGTGKGLAELVDNKIINHPLEQHDNAEYIFDFKVEADSDNFWLATDRGLIYYHAQTEKFSLIGKAQGLPFDKVFSIQQQDNQFYWLSGNQGILRISQRDMQAVLSGQDSVISRYDLFGEPDGMQSAQCNGGSMPAGTTRKDGSLWFATSLGAVSVNPIRLASFNLHTPAMVVQSLTVDGVELPQQQVKLDAGVKRIEFQFAGLSYLMPSRIMYRTKLIGFDSDWVHRGNSPSAEYTNLTPGHYEFLVSAAYPDSTWSKPVARQFEILPHFWQRLEFILLLLLVVVLSVFGSYHWRVYRVRQKEIQLSEQVNLQTQELQHQTEQLSRVVEEKTLLAMQLQMKSEAFALQARQDGLTGLANRRAFDERLAQEFNRATRLHHSLCIVMLDIDHFKRINDQWSHIAGDAVLKCVAEILTQSVREIDLAARWGGEEFVLLLPETQLTHGIEIAERLRIKFEQTSFADVAIGLKVTASFGVVVNTGYAHYEKMLSKVDSLLYQAKNEGRNQVCS